MPVPYTNNFFQNGNNNTRNQSPNTRQYLKSVRRDAQQRDLDTKAQKDVAFYWETQEVNKKRDQEKGGPPRKGKRFLEEEKDELFRTNASMAQGIDFKKYDEIEVEVSGSDNNQNNLGNIPVCNSFTELVKEFELPEWLANNINNCNYVVPTPVQKYSIPIGIKSLDIMVCAQTGSGKTCAYLMPVAMSLHRQEIVPVEKDWVYDRNETFQGKASPKALILAPTRELCSQIYLECRKVFFQSYYKTCQVYGGIDAKVQLKELSRGCDILLATPGRLIDFIEKDVLEVNNVVFLILDEADRMLDMGFSDQIEKIVLDKGMPGNSNSRGHNQSSPQRQTFMFSATFPSEIQKLASKFLKSDYIWISVGQVGAAADSVKQRFIAIHEENEKLQALHDELSCMYLVPQEASAEHQSQNLQSNRGKGKGFGKSKVKHDSTLVQSSDENATQKALIFVSMKRTASWLARELSKRCYMPSVEIHGDLSQDERERSLSKFKTGEAPILVATAVASRGLDIPHVTKVINFDLPTEIEDYVHRIGRSGRCGHHGEAVSFFVLSNGMNKGVKHDGNLAPDIAKLLQKMGKDDDLPQWLVQESDQRQHFNNNGRKKGKGKHGTQDARGKGYSSQSFKVNNGYNNGGKGGGHGNHGGGGYGGNHNSGQQSYGAGYGSGNSGGYGGGGGYGGNSGGYGNGGGSGYGNYGRN